jgi:hypothetical protein
MRIRNKIIYKPTGVHWIHILCIYTHRITHLWWICDCYVCVYRLQTVSINLNYLEYYALNCYRTFITERKLIFYWIQHLYQVYQYICCVESELFIILYILTVGFRIFCCSSPGNSTLNFPRVTRCSANGNDSTFSCHSVRASSVTLYISGHY